LIKSLVTGLEACFDLPGIFHWEGGTMMGRLASDRSKFFYEFHVDDHVPSEHLVRRIDAVLDLSWLRAKLSPFYSPMDRPSVDPELMIR